MPFSFQWKSVGQSWSLGLCSSFSLFLSISPLSFLPFSLYLSPSIFLPLSSRLCNRFSTQNLMASVQFRSKYPTGRLHTYKLWLFKKFNRWQAATDTHCVSGLCVHGCLCVVCVWNNILILTSDPFQSLASA